MAIEWPTVIAAALGSGGLSGAATLWIQRKQHTLEERKYDDQRTDETHAKFEPVMATVDQFIASGMAVIAQTEVMWAVERRTMSQVQASVMLARDAARSLALTNLTLLIEATEQPLLTIVGKTEIPSPGVTVETAELAQAASALLRVREEMDRVRPSRR